MTEAQFAALAELLRLRGGPSQEAARLVLVEGVAVGAAAKRQGIAQATASKAVASCRRGMTLARKAAGLE